MINKSSFDIIREDLIWDMEHMTFEEREKLIDSLPWCKYCWNTPSGRRCYCEADE